VRVFFFFLSISLFYVSAYADEPQLTPFAKKAHEINKILEIGGITSRPAGMDLNSVVQCRVQEMFDPLRTRFTEKDFKELSAKKCNDKLCVGDLTPFDSTLARATERAKQRLKWLEARREKPVAVETKDSIPATLRWTTWAKDEKELEERWEKQLTYDVLREILKRNPTNPESVDVETVKKDMLDVNVKALEARLLDWGQVDQADKERISLQARLTCTDKYASLLSKEEVETSGANLGLGHYPLTYGLKLVTTPDGVFVADTIPGSQASLSKKIDQFDKLLSVTVDGVKHDMTASKPTLFKVPLKAGMEMNAEFERDGKTFTVKLPVERTIGYGSMVLYQDKEVNGKKFRVISVPNFIRHDKKLSPNEDVGTDAQVERILAKKGDYDAIVLDMRSNGGGASEVGSKLAGTFLSKKENVTSVIAGKLPDGEAHGLYFKVSSKTPFSEKPLFVLMNRQTASASEIAMSSLKETGRAVFIGETSYGKGIEQHPADLADGSKLMRTAAVNLGLIGDTYHGKGIKEDLYVPFVAGTDPNLKETQKVDVPAIVKEKGWTFTGDYWQVDPAALARTKAWSEDVQKNTPQIKTYYESLKHMGEIRSSPNIPLSLRGIQDEDRRLAQESATADQLGGFDSAHSYPNSGLATDWSLVLAGRYMEEAAAKKKPAAK